MDIIGCNVMVTNKCNYDCNFCTASEKMLVGDEKTSEHIIKIKEYLYANPNIKELGWYGGEPLLKYKTLVEYINLVKELKPDLPQLLFTNGTKLRLHMVDVLAGLKRICISIDGFDDKPRSLMEFANNNCYEAFETIKALSSKTMVEINSIVTRDDLNNYRWYESIINLHKSIVHLGYSGIVISLDHEMEKPLSTDHVLNFVYGYKRINEFAIDADVYIEPRKFFTGIKCNSCSLYELIDAGGNISSTKDSDIIIDEGCNFLASKIGKEAYIYISKFLKEYGS